MAPFRSPMGCIGGAMLATFILLAAGAPVLAPFSPDAVAPASDIFASHTLATSLPPGRWTGPFPIVSADGGSAHLAAVYVFGETSGASEAILYPASPAYVDHGFGLALGNATMAPLPAGTTALSYVPLEQPFFLSSNATHAERWGPSFDPMGPPIDFGYVSQFESMPLVSGGLFGVAFAGGNEVGLLAGRDPLPAFGETTSPTWWTTASLPSGNVTAPPLLILYAATNAAGSTVTPAFASGRNESGALIVPTDRGFVAFGVDIERSGSSAADLVASVRIGPLLWSNDETASALPERALAVLSPDVDPHPDRFFAATRDGSLDAFAVGNGTMLWTVRPALRDLAGATVSNVTAGPNGLLVASLRGPAGHDGLVEVDPAQGDLALDRAAPYMADGPIAAPPIFVTGIDGYLLRVGGDRLVLVDEELRPSAEFSIPGGAATAPASLGNILVAGVAAPRTGNYFGILTASGMLYAQDLTGTLRAPLPPACHSGILDYGPRIPSGNCYLLGTDAYGHDIYSWMLWGTRAELFLGFTAAFLGVAIGTTVGLSAGYIGGRWDDVLMRITDINLTLPLLVIAILVVALFGSTLTNLILVIAALSWGVVARVIRSQTLILKERPFILAARVSGASNGRIIARHLAPHVMPLAFLFLTLSVSGAIVVEASLSFIGMGDPTTYTWGQMLEYLRVSGHSLDAPWWLASPGLAITSLSLSFYLVGRAFDDVVHPRLRSR
ncbi:MAG: ABC transporter permease [Thermoplasmatota archaeon]